MPWENTSPPTVLDLRRVFSNVAGSSAYWEKAGHTPQGYRAALVRDLLNGRGLPASLRALPLQTHAQRRDFLNRLMQSERFCTVWVHRLARLVLDQGSFTPQQLKRAFRLIRQPGGFRHALTFLLNTPQYQAAVQRRIAPPAPSTTLTPTPRRVPQASSLLVGEAFVNPYTVNRQSLVPDPITDAIAWNAGTAPSVLLATNSTTVPLQSPWGNAVVLPEVPYNTIMAGNAVQPALTLPSNLISASDLSEGITFQTWFQAKNPGALLSAELIDSSSSVSYQTPLVYIDFNGKLVAGLFDPTPLTIQQLQGDNPTILSWQNASGQTRISAANPLVSQTSVMDNTWHHVAFVATAQGQALYLDGLLQGSSRPLNRDAYTPPTSGSTITAPLSGTPSIGGLLRGSIWENGYQAYTFEGWVEGEEVSLSLAQTYNEVAYEGGSSTYVNVSTPQYVVTSATYNATGATPSLVITLSGSAPANALTINAAYPTANGVYSLTPNANLSFSGALTVGGTIVPEPASSPYPQFHYPQGFIGTLDEVALWTTPLTQTQVQAAMTAPVSQDGLDSGLAAYFNFDQSPVNNAWSNQAPGASGVAQGPTQGTLTASVITTIPTDPFSGVSSLPGARAWGIGLMTPLSVSSVQLAAGVPSTYKAALAAGDQLAIGIPGQLQGTLSVTITSDTGAAITDNLLLAPGSTQYLVAQRTGTYQLQLLWTPSASGMTGTVNFEQLPGPLNSLSALLTSYTDHVSISETVPLFAYSDPTLATLADYSPGLAAAPYWPLWSDTLYFPVPANTDAANWASELNTAYQTLVMNLPAGSGLSDFANVINAAITLPISTTGTPSIQQALEEAYTTAFGTPPAPPSVGQFPVGANIASEAVYEFLYNANLLRQNFYEVLVGGSANPSSLQGWVQQVINGISGQDGVPVTIANTISSGQTKQVQNITTTAPNPALQSTKQIVEGALEWAVGGVLGALLGVPGLGGAVVGAALGGAGASVANSFSNMAGASTTLSITVPVTPITNNMLDYGTLNDIATSLNAVMIQQWNAILAALNNPLYVQAVMSNYGLLQALSPISSAPLGNPALSPTAALTTTLSNASWRTMIPAVFTWQPVKPYNFLSGDGRTTYLVSQMLSLTDASNPLGIATGDFNGDGFLDLATANSGTSNINVLLSNGNSSNGTPSFAAAVAYGLNGPNGARSIVSADFDKDDYADLAVANHGTSNVSVLLSSGSSGTFPTATMVPLNGPDGAFAITTGDFNGDGNPDLAVSNNGTRDSDNVSVLLGDGAGGFGTAATYGLGGPDSPWGIASGDLNNDGYDDLVTANFGSGSLSVLLSTGNTGIMAPAQVIYLNLQLFGTADVATGDFNNDGKLDLVVSDTAITVVLLGKGDGSFNTPVPYPSIPASGAVAVRDWDNNGYDDIVVASPQGGVGVAFNVGDGTFFTSAIYAADEYVNAVTVGDFNGDGIADIGLAYANDNVVVLSGATVGTFATFLPDSAIESTSINTLLEQVQSLQGGNAVSVGPYDSSSLITPSTSNPPNYMAYVGLPYLPDAGPLSIAAPGWFLSVTPATLSQSTSDYNYSQSGNFVTGWNLFDSNSNPIAAETLQQLFGTPVPQPLGSSPRLTGVELVPIDAERPFVGMNGGWFYGVHRVPGAATTWAEAFFVWGLGTTNYSPRNLVPNYETSSGSGTQSGTLNGTALWFPSNFEFTLTLLPATGAPPEA